MKFVMVSGESIVDWVVPREDAYEQRPGAGAKSHQLSQSVLATDELHGGAHLISDFVQGVKIDEFALVEQPWPSAWADRVFKKLSHNYATLRGYPRGSDGERRWRMEEYLGSVKRPLECKMHKDFTPKQAPDPADIVTLVDLGLDYGRDERHWPLEVKNGSPWTVLKLGGPAIANKDNPLWNHVSVEARRDKLIVITTVDDLRRTKGIEISRGLSWERAAGDCAAALRGKKSPLSALADRAAYVIVSFGPVGALVYDRKSQVAGHNSFTLIFDPQRLEDSSAFWGEGKMWGYTSALTAAVVRVLMSHVSSDEAGENPDIKKAARAGLNGMLAIYEEGFGVIPALTEEGGGGDVIQFPTEKACTAIKESIETGEGKRMFAEASFSPSASLQSWNILTDKYNKFTHDLTDIARTVVVKGPAALKGAPWMTYGELTTVDRGEIESLESIRGLIGGYVAEKTDKHFGYKGDAKKPPPPLSIAVFGAPGSGKSTAVKELVQSLKVPGVKFEPKIFNLSEFRSPQDLEDALHLVRDERLQGKIPLVFWDEFDAYYDRNLGWLRFFLSPMQDGTFRAGQAIHPIGKAIFAFAGGTSSTLNEFQDQSNFVDAKGPDFLSRVQGTIELRGIDALHGDTDFDSQYVIRRAVLLNSILKKQTSLLDVGAAEVDDVMDSGVLDAFLTVSEYRHGVRSMKAIIAASSLAGETHFGRSNLPAETQVNLHVDARDFYTKMRHATTDEVR
ncbi:ATP-binding protein [Streptomyces massasporeus]